MISLFLILLLCAVIVGVGLVIWALAVGRHRRWGLVVWIPSFLIPALMGPAIVSSWPEPDDNWRTLASIMMLAYAVPYAIVGLAALILYPKRPVLNIWGALGGLCICILPAFGSVMRKAPIAEVLVLDQAGKPAAGIVITQQHQDNAGASPETTGRTNARGLARFNIPYHRDGWRAQVTTVDGVTCTASIGSPKNASGTRTKIRERETSWACSNWGYLRSRAIEYVPATEGQRLTIRLRSSTERLSSAVIEHLRAEIEAFRHGSSPALRYSGPEVLMIMPEFLDAFRTRYHSPQLEADAPTSILDHLAYEISTAGMTLARMRKQHPDDAAVGAYPTFCAWAEASAHSPDSLAKVDAKVRTLVNDLVATAKPFWKSQGPVGIRQLEDLMQPHLPELIRFMEQEMPEQNARYFASVIENCHAPTELLAPYLDSPNRTVQVTVLEEIKDTIPPAELRARATQLSRPDEQSFIQNKLYWILQHAARREAEAGRRANQ